VAETIALLSECLTLEPGDVIAMGTPAGVGQSRVPPRWMKDGDTIEVEIEGVGLLVNRIESEARP
jgi:2-keto-4-pentenoate hydratase/2-oxohepta-3-ene-1,7-dioic acid hydratase in catechol pathway